MEEATTTYTIRHQTSSRCRYARLTSCQSVPCKTCSCGTVLCFYPAMDAILAGYYCPEWTKVVCTARFGCNWSRFECNWSLFAAIDHALHQNLSRIWKNLDCFAKSMWAMCIIEVTFDRPYFSKYNGISYLAKKWFFLSKNGRFQSILNRVNGPRTGWDIAWKSDKTSGRDRGGRESAMPAIEMRRSAYIIARVAQQWGKQLIRLAHRLALTAWNLHNWPCRIIPRLARPK